jgi:hypothetical protein
MADPRFSWRIRVGGGNSMPSETHFFMVWAHRSRDSIFGAASYPVVRNGVFLCFQNEEKARAETDRLNARSGGSNVHYSVKPTPVQMALPRALARERAADRAFAIALSSAPCTVSAR